MSNKKGPEKSEPFLNCELKTAHCKLTYGQIPKFM